MGSVGVVIDIVIAGAVAIAKALGKQERHGGASALSPLRRLPPLHRRCRWQGDARRALMAGLQAATLVDTATSFSGGELEDDLTLVVVGLI